MLSISSSGRLLAAASLCVLSASAVADERPGNLWKTTSQMVMEGVPMPPQPPQTTQLCTAKEWNQPPPPPAGQTCTQTDFERSGNKVTWKVQCTGEMEMSGDGEITFESPDSYKGEIKLDAGGMNMTIRLTGEKIDECDNPVG
jgi:hypothetical protein